ncbi:hypothetical protein PGT21_023409 [Puccinia graminis f. sp. tritici]|uniref:Uncharacterized protein n=2 Tax=Puccinia graminis f. sp. tritici TaxID=56615 RepID=E3K518_PUCGT|nr:uncharacterized protein PGTG_05654 [Puccinia graminis f. sp. tritici CRL 75-36-700-3]EFP79333.1 hypothetical protein PGTG_05654 [Puccinia graminis f. sp. tritici CRL 75-36-700-3]KAA1087133.1 hypothetical protein PGT21_023409 [Puccinia graminis f. sp. tritici]
MAPKRKTSAGKKHRKQGDRVVEGFERLIKKFDPTAAGNILRSHVHEPFQIDQSEVKRDLLHDLRSNLLPQLGGQIINLLLLLDPNRLREDPGGHLKLILGIQSELDQTLSRIESATFSYPHATEPLSDSIEFKDQDLKEIKWFRLDGLYWRINGEFLVVVTRIFLESNELLQQMKLSTTEFHDQPDIDYTREQIVYYASSSLEGIELAIEWLDGSEFDLVQIDWPSENDGFSENMDDLLSLTNRTSHLEQGIITGGSAPGDDPAIKLSKSLLPVFKLCRLLFKKLSKRGLNKEHLPLFTKASSVELEHVADMGSVVSYGLRNFLGVLESVDRSRNRLAHPDCAIMAAKIQDHVEIDVSLITHYFVPLIPDTDPLPIQNHYKDWLATWTSQFRLAIRNFLNAALSFDEGTL